MSLDLSIVMIKLDTSFPFSIKRSGWSRFVFLVFFELEKSFANFSTNLLIVYLVNFSFYMPGLRDLSERDIIVRLYNLINYFIFCAWLREHDELKWFLKYTWPFCYLFSCFIVFILLFCFQFFTLSVGNFWCY